MTPDELAADRAVIAGATPGPWTVAPWDSPREWEAGWQIDAPGVDDCIVEAGHGREGSICDAAFIAAARTRWPAALDEIEQLRRDLTETQNSVVELAEEIEWLRGNKKVSRD